jgi:hypothetical protein
MTRFDRFRVSLNIWPFLILAPVESLALIFAVRLVNPQVSGPFLLVSAAVCSGAVVLVAIAGVSFFRWRGVTSRWGIISVYSLLAVMTGLLLSGLVQLMVRIVEPDVPEFPIILTILYAVSRPINVLLLAMIVAQLKSGMTSIRSAESVVRASLRDAQQVNIILDRAERNIRGKSLDILRREVEEPMRALVRNGENYTDQELTAWLDAYISQQLRPLSHHLHPVSIRVGLIAALQTLGPNVEVDCSADLTRLDADSTLLDERVRLQVFRWVQGNVREGQPLSVAVSREGDVLIITLSGTASMESPDPVQLVAGLRERAPGVVQVPLGSHVPPPIQPPMVEKIDESQEPRLIRLPEILTVPLGNRIGMVALLALGAMPLQFVIFRWAVTWSTLAAVLSFAGGAIVITALFALLPRPRATVSGALRVIGEWTAVAIAAVFAFTFVSSAVGLGADFSMAISFDIFRGLFRFTLPGLCLVIAHGFLVQSKLALGRMQMALDDERLQRSRILEQAQAVDLEVAEVLHRTVQGRLSAALILINLGRRDEAWTHITQMAESEIPMLLNRIESSSELRSPLIDEIPGLVASVDGPLGDISNQLFFDLRRIANEIALNARRHGEASDLDVRVALDHGWCTLTFVDNGRGLSDALIPGLGSRLLDDVTARYRGSWIIQPDVDGGCRVEVRVVMDGAMSAVV